MRRTTFSASGEIDTGALPEALRRVLASISASAKKAVLGSAERDDG